MADAPDAISLLDDEPQPKATPPKDPATGRFVSPNPPASASDNAPSVSPVSPHPAYLVSQAHEHLGLDDAEINATPTHVLSKAVHTALNRQIHERNFLLQQHALTNQHVQQPAPAAPKDELDGWEWGQDEEGKPLSASNYAPAMVNGFRRLAKENQELRQAIQHQHQRESAREFERGTSLIDDAFESLPEKYAKIAGPGTGTELREANHPAFARRLAILQAAGVRFDQLPGSKSLQKKIQKAADDLFFAGIEEAKPSGDAAYSDAAANGRITPEQWQQGAVAKPTQRREPREPKGEKLAIKNLEAKQAELARQQGGEDGEVMDTLLG